MAVETTVRISHYSWGTLRVVEKGNRFRAVIDPSVWELISGQLAGRFTDEQGVAWAFRRDDDGLLLTASGGRLLAIRTEDLR